MRGRWKDDPDVMFEVAKEAAEEWRIVGQVDKHRKQQYRGKSDSSGAKALNSSKDSHSEDAGFGAEACVDGRDDMRL